MANSFNNRQNNIIIDKFVFLGSLFLVIGLSIPMLFLGDIGEEFIRSISDYLMTNFGFLNILIGLFAIGICIYICFSEYGDIVLGDKNDKPEYKTISWATMMFCAGIGSSVMYWGVIEWIFYYVKPPFGMEAGSWQVAEFAASYGIFHWGPTGWALYVLPALPIAYCYFVKKENAFKVSHALKPILKEKADSYLGKTIDIIFIFASMGACATSLGLCVPMVSTGVSEIFNMKQSTNLSLVILLLIVAIFTISSYFGLKKGIQVLSNINVGIVVGILLFVFITGPTVFIIKMGVTSIGVIGQNFLKMSTWLDPINNSGFPERWTVFYWGWWVISAPIIGMFIAKISKGRTIRQMISGAIIYGTLGCALVFVILGNYGLYLQISGTFDVISYLQNFGANATIFKILGMLKMGKVVIFLFTIGAIIFASTTFDSISYIIASCTVEHLDENQEPPRWSRLFWAILLALIPSIFILIDGPLETIQSSTNITVIPGIILMCLLTWSFFKMAEEGKDHIR